jgi:DNA-binding NarL/FixJ family response regulator
MLQDVDLVGEFHSYDGCTEAVESSVRLLAGEPTVVVVALDEIDEPARYALRQTARAGAKVLILVDNPDVSQLSRLSGVSSSGFLATNELSAETLRVALQRMHGAEMPISPRFVRTLLAVASDGAGPTGSPAGVRMTAREQEVLGLLVEGLSNKQIARRLTISEHGAKRHVANILAKLNSPNRTVAVANALRYGLCEQWQRPAI